MLTKVRYSPKDILLWTRWETAFLLLYLGGVTALYELLDLRFLHVPWAPVAVLGTAVAFIVGFQNNAAYGRIWEARKIWGGIVNVSRTWGMQTLDMVDGRNAESPVSEEELREHRQILIHRHVAWLTALRHAMRQPRSWEGFQSHRTNREWSDKVHIPERLTSLEEDLAGLLPAGECEEVLARTNRAAGILNMQSRHLARLAARGIVWKFAFLRLEDLLKQMFDLQGASERIKNFPYPRQYATLSFQFVRMFVVALPFAAVPEFSRIGRELSETAPQVAPWFIWGAVPFLAMISWVFLTMERIGRVGENPFEGTANDVPISTMSRGIEIDLRQMLAEDPGAIPAQFPESHSVQM